MVICGKQAIDDCMPNQTRQMLVCPDGSAQATFASKLAVSAARRTVAALRSTAALETLEIALPAVATTDLRLNEPALRERRRNIMKAKKKPLETVKPADLASDAAPPPYDPQGRRAAQAQRGHHGGLTWLSLLETKNEAKVL